MLDRPEGSPVLVVVSDHDQDWMMEVANELALHPQIRVVGFAQTGENAVNRAVSLAADAVLINYSMPDYTATEVAKKLADLSPGTITIAVAATMSAQLVMTGKGQGLAEIYARDGFVAREAAEKIASMVDARRREWADTASKHGLVSPGTGPQGVRTVEKVVTRSITQSIILVHSPKGGVGKSTIAANLATAIKMSPVLSGVRVALLDFDVEFGNLKTLFSIPPEIVQSRNVATWQQVSDDMTAQEVDDLLVPTKSTGLMVLPSPINPAVARRVDIELADKILRTLRKYYGVIVIDGGPKLPHAVDAAIQHATHILLVSTLRGQAAENLNRVVAQLQPDPDLMQKADMSHILRKMSVVINMAGESRGDLRAADVAEIVGRPIIAEIPKDDVVTQAENSGDSLQAVETAPNSPFARAIRSLANDICSAYPMSTDNRNISRKRQKRGLLSRLFG